MRTLAVATANPHKLREIRQLLEPLGYRVLGLEHWPGLGELPEEGGTFAENALSKARALHARVGGLVAADDTGLEVDALGGLPGVRSKRFTPEATAEANNARLLRELAAFPEPGQRRARFRTVVALVGELGGRYLERLVEGCCEGRIAHEPRGTGGFGYDPLFLPDEAPGRSMAELSLAEKNRISHRGRAFRALARLLQELRAGEERA